MFLDEFHNYGGDTFISTLSEARKYRLSLILANQFIDQLSVPLQKAILGNVGTMISFGIGPSDAEMLSEVFSYSPETLSSLSPFEICVRGLGEGMEVETWRGRSRPPIEAKYGNSNFLFLIHLNNSTNTNGEIDKAMCLSSS